MQDDFVVICIDGTCIAANRTSADGTVCTIENGMMNDNPERTHWSKCSDEDLRKHMSGGFCIPDTCDTVKSVAAAVRDRPQKPCQDACEGCKCSPPNYCENLRQFGGCSTDKGLEFCRKTCERCKFCHTSSFAIKKSRFDFADEFNVGDVRYKHLTQITIKVQLF